MSSITTPTTTNSNNATSSTTSGGGDHHHVTRRMICGGIAGMIAKTVTNPLDRIRMLAQTGEHGSATTTTASTAAATAAAAKSSGSSSTRTTNVYRLYRDIIKREGIIGLWAGNGANLLRVFPAKAIVFSCNDIYTNMIYNATTSSSSRCNQQQQNNKKKNSSSSSSSSSGWIGFLSGGLAGMTATACTYPLDLARARIAGKLATTTTSGTSSTSTTSTRQHTKHYGGIIQTIVLTVKEEGTMALFRGITPTLLGAMPYEGIKFGTVAILEHTFPPSQQRKAISSNSSTENNNNNQKNNKSSSSDPIRKMLFGGMGGIMASLITYPNDTIRRLLQLQGSRGTNATYNGYFDCMKQTYIKYGISRFYHGITLNVIRMAPNAAVQFGSYELLKQYFI